MELELGELWEGLGVTGGSPWGGRGSFLLVFLAVFTPRSSHMAERPSQMCAVISLACNRRSINV